MLIFLQLTLLIIVIPITVMANEKLNWVNSLKSQGQIITRDIIIEKLKELDDLNSRGQSNFSNNGHDLASDIRGINDNKVVLKVFVSNSMPLNLLKVYYRQVVKYGGTLVFKGLPNGSFKELTKLVMAISESNEPGSMQIDDEAFEHFGIKTVPAILLIKEADYFNEGFEGNSYRVTYDKVIGSIGVRAALERFAENGDLSKEARGLLGQ